MKKNYDVIIIGGGIIGVCTAYYLSKLGIKIALFEKNDLASGSSSHCDSSILVSGKKPGFDTLVAYHSHRLYEEILDDITNKFEYIQKGSMYVCQNLEELMIAKDYVEKQAKNGFNMRMLNKREIHEEEPFLAKDIIGGFLELDYDASINPMKFIYALSTEASKKKTFFFTYCPVYKIKFIRKNSEYIVYTNTGNYSTKIIVNCAGVWARDIGKMIGIDIPVYPKKGQILVTEKTIEVCKRKITEFNYISKKYANNSNDKIDDHNVSFVIFPTMDFNYLIGSSRQLEGYCEEVDINIMQLIAQRAIKFIPVLKNINIIRIYTGLRPYVQDNNPIISQVDEFSGFYIAAGHEGSGIGNGPITGKLISQFIKKERPLIPIKQFSFNRFKKKNFNIF